MWRLRRWWWIAAVVLALVAVGEWGVPAWRVARARQLRRVWLEELRPVTLENCTLARFGSSNDGGYLLCENLIETVEAAYSYGVGPNDAWGCEISTRYQVPVHQYDCFDPARPVCPTGQFLFHDECIGAQPERFDGRLFDTLSNQIAANGDAGKRAIVKIDVEGAEWDALLATPDAVLERIDQLPMELHGYDAERFLPVMQKLKRTFYLVNLHFNNYACDEEAEPLPARAYQVLFVNKRLGVLSGAPWEPAATANLNAPDDPMRPDCQWDFTPAGG